MNIGDGRAYRIGRAVAQHLDAKSIVIGDDTSETSPTFVLTALKAFLRGCQRSRNYLAEQSHEISDNGVLWVGGKRIFRIFRTHKKVLENLL